MCGSCPKKICPCLKILFSRLTVDNIETYLVVMRNVFSSHMRIHKKYDLKGSTVDREVCSIGSKFILFKIDSAVNIFCSTMKMIVLGAEIP